MRTRLAAFLSLTILSTLPSSRLCAVQFTLENDQVSFVCESKGGHLLPGTLKDKKTGQIVKLGRELFNLVLTNGSVIHADQFKLKGSPHIISLAVNTKASRFAERLPGQELVAEMSRSDGELAEWHVILRDGSRYVRQQFVLNAGKKALPLKGIMMLEAPNVTARATGTVDGCPVADKTTFTAWSTPSP
jgi:hypothetical protein